MKCDVAVIGGGPAGSTLGTFLKMYNPSLEVCIFERETFPRDHIGESHLPTISYILDEMGVWDQVEAANFPIKIGATYKWGKTKELWDFNFLPDGKLPDRPRPDKFEGARRYTAFQVDRSVYDTILIDNAGSKGCKVFQNAKVTKVDKEGDSVTSLELADGQSIEARYYVDASGHSGILRRAFDVPVEYPTSLQNIAVWDYFQNAEWAEEIGVGGTRIQIMSLGYGWIWFIPLGPTRTSVGLVMPADHYKKSGKRPAELLTQALKEDERITHLMRNATSEGKVSTTKDWSFLASRMYGENWFLVGESSGFADPILSAGLTITHAAAREAAFTILELDRGKEDADWLKSEYQRIQEGRVRTHIRFADYWYSANAQFQDLKEYTSKIAEENGLDLSPDKAWAWIAQGGFIDDDFTAGTATLSLTAIRALGTYLSPMDVDQPLDRYNVFRLNLKGAKRVQRAQYEKGRVQQYDAYVRESKMLPLVSVYRFIFEILERRQTLPAFLKEMNLLAQANKGSEEFRIWILNRVPVAMEAMIASGWIDGSYDARLPLVPPNRDSKVMNWHVGK